MTRFAALLILVGCDTAAMPEPDAGPPAMDAGSDAGSAATDAGPTGDGGFTCEPAIVYPPDLLPECPSCPGARCVAGELLTETLRDGLRDCSPTHECMPDEYLLAGEAYVPPTCEAGFGAEGRCLSICLPGVGEEQDILLRDTCPETHRCVPCFNPFDGEPTGACDAQCDEGPVDEPVVLPSCCDARGACVPTDLVEEPDRAYFDACEGDDALCVPIPIARDPAFEVQDCTAEDVAALYGEEYGPGVCGHPCQAGLAEVAPFLQQDDCPEEFLCVSCLDPMTGEPSGACD